MERQNAHRHSPAEIKADEKQLNVNITSIVIGALVILTLLAWIAAIKSLCEHIIEDDRTDRYCETKRKFFSALVVTLLSAFVIMLVYVSYTTGS